MWEKLKHRTLRFIPRSNTRIFRGTFVQGYERYSDMAIVEVNGIYEGDRNPYNQSFYVQLASSASHGTKGLAPGLEVVKLKGRKGVAPELVTAMPYMDVGNNWEKIVDDDTGEVLIGPKK